MYDYNAEVLEVVDGDTYTLRIDQGFSNFTDQRIRLEGVDCPERNTKPGQDAKAWVTKVFADHGNKVVVQTQKLPARSFERYVAQVFVDGKSLADLVIETGHGVPFRH